MSIFKSGVFLINLVQSLFRHKCPTALLELKSLHYSFLNQAYHQDVYQSWKNDGCYGDIHRLLGYTLALRKTSLPKKSYRGQCVSIRLELENKGYAAPVKKLNVRIVFRKG